MDTNKTQTVVQSGGVSLFTVVFIVLFILKVAGVEAVASLSWWWIFAVLFFPLLAFLVAALIAFVFAATLTVLGRAHPRVRRKK